MKKASEIGKIRKLFLRVLTELQEYALFANQMWLYFFWTKLHFKTYYGFTLGDAIFNHKEEFEIAARRHTKMVLGIVFKKSSFKSKKRLSKTIKDTFYKNILVETPL